MPAALAVACPAPQPNPPPPIPPPPPCRDLARAARTCREFAAYVREQRRSLPTVVVPEGVSLTAVRWGLRSARPPPSASAASGARPAACYACCSSRACWRLAWGLTAGGPPPSAAGCRSLVAAFGGARGVSLWRCAAALRFQHEFEDMLRAVALGQSDRWAACPRGCQLACSWGPVWWGAGCGVGPVRRQRRQRGRPACMAVGWQPARAACRQHAREH